MPSAPGAGPQPRILVVTPNRALVFGLGVRVAGQITVQPTLSDLVDVDVVVVDLPAERDDRRAVAALQRHARQQGTGVVLISDHQLQVDPSTQVVVRPFRLKHLADAIHRALADRPARPLETVPDDSALSVTPASLTFPPQRSASRRRPTITVVTGSPLIVAGLGLRADADVVIEGSLPQTLATDVLIVDVTSLTEPQAAATALATRVLGAGIHLVLIADDELVVAPPAVVVVRPFTVRAIAKVVRDLLAGPAPTRVAPTAVVPLPQPDPPKPAEVPDPPKPAEVPEPTSEPAPEPTDRVPDQAEHRLAPPPTVPPRPAERRATQADTPTPEPTPPSPPAGPPPGEPADPAAAGGEAEQAAPEPAEPKDEMVGATDPEDATAASAKPQDELSELPDEAAEPSEPADDAPTLPAPAERLSAPAEPVAPPLARRRGAFGPRRRAATDASRHPLAAAWSRAKARRRPSEQDPAQLALDERLAVVLSSTEHLQAVAEDLPVVRSLPTLLRVVTESIAELLDADAAVYWRRRSEGWLPAHTVGVLTGRAPRPVPFDQPLLDELHTTGGALLFDPVDRVQAAVVGLTGTDRRSLIAAGVGAAGERFGVLTLSRDRSFDVDDLDQLTSLTQEASLVIAVAEHLRSIGSLVRGDERTEGDDDSAGRHEGRGEGRRGGVQDRHTDHRDRGDGSDDDTVGRAGDGGNDRFVEDARAEVIDLLRPWAQQRNRDQV